MCYLKEHDLQGFVYMLCLQVLSLQSATTQPQTQAVDYRSGIEAMVLAILQQTNVTLLAQQAKLLAMQTAYLNAHDESASFANLIKLYADYLAEALARNVNLSLTFQSSILHLNRTRSLLPVSYSVTSLSCQCFAYALPGYIC